MANTLIKRFYYCENHDDAFYVKSSTEEVNPSDLFITNKCCTTKRECELKFIGNKVFEGDTLIKDTTPDDIWFDRRGGGYEKEYLDSAIDLY